MNYDETKEPIYENKVNKVIAELSEGKSKEEVAKNAGYGSFKTLSNYMRRKNFSWVGKENKFIPTVEKNAPRKNHLFAIDNTKAGKIVSLFQDKEKDAKLIAEKVGFDSHSSMAKFMESEGYKWDSELENYIKEAKDKKKFELQDEKMCDAKEEGEVKYDQDLEQYLPLLEFIKENEEQLRIVLDPMNGTGQMNRYLAPGTKCTNSVYMLDSIATLAKQYCDEKNIHQGDLYEAALIECLRKHGYSSQIEHLLNS